MSHQQQQHLNEPVGPATYGVIQELNARVVRLEKNIIDLRDAKVPPPAHFPSRTHIVVLFISGFTPSPSFSFIFPPSHLFAQCENEKVSLASEQLEGDLLKKMASAMTVAEKFASAGTI